MNVRIMDISYLNRIAKFMSLTMAVGKAKEKVINFHRLNCLNYCKYHNVEFNSPKYSIDDIDITAIPLISSVQAVSDLEAVYFNCLEYGDELDFQAIEEMRIRIEQFKEHFEYDFMKRFKDHILY